MLYDVLDRLTAANDATNSESWTYDGNGNRITQTGNYGQATLSYNSNNNQFQPSTYYYPGQGYSGGYDAAGNSSVVGGEGVYYDAEGNVDTQLIDLGATNGLRQRVASETGPVEQRIVYGEDGHIVGEYYYDAADYLPPLIPREETIWLGDLPVATMMTTGEYSLVGDPTGLDIVMYYVHADQLGSPRRLTRPSDNQLVWRWDSDPFGFKFGSGHYTAAQVDPLGLGVYAPYNLRFPGQLVGAALDTFYNWYRDYDPLSGRYLQSDPIGLKGGSYSTYVYVSNDPVSAADPRGLVMWRGTYASGSIGYKGAGAEHWIFTLFSDCVNSQKWGIRVSATAGGPGLGLPWTITGSTVEFDDHSATPSPSAFNGVFKFASAGFAGTIGYGWSEFIAGSATARLSGAVEAGIDFSLSSGVGQSSVTSKTGPFCCSQ
jgi:RHS repeat-associated protein